MAEVILAYMSDKVPEGTPVKISNNFCAWVAQKNVSVRQNNGMNRARGLLSLSLSVSLARFFAFPLSLYLSFPCVQPVKANMTGVEMKETEVMTLTLQVQTFPLPDHDCPWKNTVFEFRAPKYQTRLDTSHSRDAV